MKRNSLKYIDGYSEYTDYFLKCEEDWNKFNNEYCNIIFIKIFNSILFEKDKTVQNKKISYAIFWINFFIEKCQRDIEEPLLTTFVTIINKLDLQQLIQYTASNNQNMDFSSELDYEIRKVFDEKMALTDSQISIALSILNKDNIVFSAPTSYGKTNVVLSSLLTLIEKNLINSFVAILPTKALINEYRKNINAFFKGKELEYTIIDGAYTEPGEGKNIFLFTQERFLIFNNQFKTFKFDYALFDEAQNLINALNKSNNERHILLAKSLAIIDSIGTPKIFLMPYISEPYLSFISKFVSIEPNSLKVVDSLYPPTSSSKYLIKKKDNSFKLFDVTSNRGFYNNPKEIALNITNPNENDDFGSIKYDLYKICNSDEVNCLNEKNLFYCNKNEIREIADLFSKEILYHNNSSNREKALISYLSEYIGEDFELIEFLKKGVCIHTGDLDSFTKRQIENLFLDNNSGINHIFCTSTLLQGVNLNANNLFFLAKKGNFSNSLLDKKNLFGRVGRLGNCLQGRIFRFYVETRSIKFDTIKEELDTSSEPCVFNDKDFLLPEEEKRTDALKAYLSDKDVKNQLKTSILDSNDSLDCFDYFLGIENSKKIDAKISALSQEEIDDILHSLTLKNYDCYSRLVETLCELYDWKESNDSEVSQRMINIDFVTRLFYNVSIGTSVKQYIQSVFNVNKKEGKSPYVVTRKGKDGVWFLTESQYNNYKYNTYLDVRPYNEKDKNILVYATLREINDIIEFRLKMFIQDLYYRLKTTNGTKFDSIEDFLTHSLVGNKRKIGLKNIGVIDEFALNKLVEIPELFDNDVPNTNRIIEYADSLDITNPIRYSIEDVLS